MRLKCDCLVQNSTTGTSANNQQQKKKPRSCIVSIGMEKRLGVLLVTNSSLKPEFHCRLVDNVETVFDKFIQNGKITVRFKEPQTDVLISDADPVSLNQFVKALRCLAKGGKINEFVNNHTLKSKDFEKPPVRILFVKKSEYPFHDPIPASLEYFQAIDCQLKRFDTRILKLKNLTRLNLHKNALKIDLHLMNFSPLIKLQEICLSSNDLEGLPVEFWSNLPVELHILDLKENRLRNIPEIVWNRLKQLTHLRINHNNIESISWRIMKLRNSLEHLDLSANRLKFVPFEIRRLNQRLQFCDFSRNPFHMQFSRAVRLSAHETTLLDLSAIAVEKYGLPTNELPGHLAAYVDEQVWPCSECSTLSVKSNLGRAIRYTDPRNVARMAISTGPMPTETFYCKKCLPKSNVFMHN